MNEQTRKVVLAMSSRSACHFIDRYFESIKQDFSVSRFLDIEEDELFVSWISIKTVIEIQKLQIQLKKNLQDGK